MTIFKRITAIFSLCVYTGFLLIAVIHVHQIQISDILIISNPSSQSSNNAKDPFSDEQSNCKLVQLSRTSYSFTPNNIWSGETFPNEIFKFSTSNLSFHESSIIYNYSLRAPPSA